MSVRRWRIRRRATRRSRRRRGTRDRYTSKPSEGIHSPDIVSESLPKAAGLLAAFSSIQTPLIVIPSRVGRRKRINYIFLCIIGDVAFEGEGAVAYC